ncbi:AMP-binding protein [Aquibaculum arenosum]|uniref:AMP-binding protein n=1 Tax=Aquibaculum arenosum TaxID=3032591 RepID=A0ABT5YM91_9PROT|nr:AMP-binding protein [Fodinicurvata sp. CAU 1616]MDF2096049.1 AMP-binding protein [Fodinicurvata sp. CAU 1616]
MTDSSALGPTFREFVTALAEVGDVPAVQTVQGEQIETLSYRELSERALRLAAGLHRRGVQPGEPVLLFAPNSLDWVTVRLALAALGAIGVALDELTSDAELKVLLPDSGARRAFVSGAFLARVRAVSGDLDLIRLDGEAEGDPAPHWQDLLADAPEPLPPIAADDPMIQVYTSGTTGTPKSFFLSHANLLHNISAMVERQIVTDRDRVVMPLPLHHVFPLTIGIGVGLGSRAILVLPEGVTGPQIMTALKVARATVLLGVPRLFAAILAGLEGRVAQQPRLQRLAFRTLFALSHFCLRRFGWRIGRRLFGSLHQRIAPDLWLLASGGAKFDADIIWKLDALGWDTRSGWGLAESASVLSYNHGGPEKRIGSEGKALPGVELRVAEPDAEGVGELQARGGSLFSGYRGGPEVNEGVFTEDGWFRTGDLGRLDAEGFVYIHGRVKEMLVLGGGKNVFPEEVEAVYRESPVIEEIAVMEERGALVAVVVPDMAAATAAGTAVEPVIRAALAEQGASLAPYQRLAGFALSREPLPRTRLGKYQRFKLPELYRRIRAGEQRPAADAPLTAEEEAFLNEGRRRELLAFLKSRYPERPVSLDASPGLDLGIDSLEWVTLSMELESRFGLTLPTAVTAEILSVRDLLAQVKPLEEGASERALIRPLAEEEAEWLRPRGPGMRALGTLLYGLNAVVQRLYFRLELRGEPLPPADAGPVLYVVNHLSDLDPPVMAAALGYRRLQSLRWSGERSRLFHSPVMRLVSRAARIFPVDERDPSTTLSYGAETLRRGESLVWFPESWRSPDGRLQSFLSGVGHLLLAQPVTAVPLYIDGTFEVMPRHASFPRPGKVTVTAGPALEAQSLAALDDAQAIADHLRAAVAALAPPAKR